MPRRGKKNLAKVAFDPDDARRVRHTKLGVWDLYQEVTPQIQHLPGSNKIEQYAEVVYALPYVWKMFKDLGTMKDCQFRLILLLFIQILAALVPATALWYSGQLLTIVEKAVETRTVDTHLLAQIAAGHIICAVLSRSLNHAINRIRIPLIRIISNFYSTHLFRVYARLDYATFEDPIIMQQLNEASGGRYSVAWEMVNTVITIATSTVRLGSQLSVLAGIVYGQPDGLLFCALSLLGPMLQILPYSTFGLHGVWAATCRNEDYIRSVGMKNAVRTRSHRQEIVAGGLGDHIVSEYETAQSRAGLTANSFFETYNEHMSRDRLGSLSLLSESLSELPLIAFALRAPLYPAAIPVSLASLQLIRSTVTKFQMDVLSFFHQFGSVTERLDQIRKLYQVVDIPNKIIDGKISFPENQQKLSSGVALEFRNVSFKYPGSKDYALRNVSFKLTEGQLCVIVGKNGSGKSTILKLVSRLYDPSEGEILIDGYDLRSLKLADLRKAIAVLFQDYSHFPVSVKENIGLGDPTSAHDQDKIEAAAKLGGAYEFITKLPEGFDTYLDRPVQDVYGNLPEGTKTIFGKEVSYHSIRGGGGFAHTTTSHLSGGQMQRLAVSRTFMRTLRSEEEVGILLFDEPSASLDPTAEHELFERLRALRGGKTMIFSSHRFGNLTRHSDVIIYMDDSQLKEIGTHKELLEREGDYARIYSLQAQAFLP